MEFFCIDHSVFYRFAGAVVVVVNCVGYDHSPPPLIVLARSSSTAMDFHIISTYGWLFGWNEFLQAPTARGARERRMKKKVALQPARTKSALNEERSYEKCSVITSNRGKKRFSHSLTSQYEWAKNWSWQHTEYGHFGRYRAQSEFHHWHSQRKRAIECEESERRLHELSVCVNIVLVGSVSMCVWLCVYMCICVFVANGALWHKQFSVLFAQRVKYNAQHSLQFKIK